MHVPNSVLTVKRCLQGEGASRRGGWRWSLQGRCDINIYAQIFLNITQIIFSATVQYAVWEV